MNVPLSMGLPNLNFGSTKGALFCPLSKFSLKYEEICVAKIPPCVPYHHTPMLSDRRAPNLHSSSIAGSERPIQVECGTDQR
jgi:hypothetical protein